jgi:hypothetical protein
MKPLTENDAEAGLGLIPEERARIEMRAGVARAIRDEAREVASVVEHPNQEYCRNSTMATLIVAAGIGTDYSEPSLRKSRCPYAVINGRRLYADADLQALIAQILDKARPVGVSAA